MKSTGSGPFNALASVLTIACCAMLAGSAWGLSPRVAVCTPAKTPPKMRNPTVDTARWREFRVATHHSSQNTTHPIPPLSLCKALIVVSRRLVVR